MLNSRYVNYPLHILECVMPCAGGIAFIMTTAERARLLRRPPVYVLGAAVAQGFDNSWLTPDICQTATAFSAPAAYRMAGYGPKDFQFAEFYDCYTILHATTLEDAGICPKGEIGPFFESTDTTFKGSFHTQRRTRWKRYDNDTDRHASFSRLGRSAPDAPEAAAATELKSLTAGAVCFPLQRTRRGKVYTYLLIALLATRCESGNRTRLLEASRGHGRAWHDPGTLFWSNLGLDLHGKRSRLHVRLVQDPDDPESVSVEAKQRNLDF